MRRPERHSAADFPRVVSHTDRPAFNGYAVRQPENIKGGCQRAAESRRCPRMGHLALNRRPRVQLSKRMCWFWKSPPTFDDGPVGAQHPGAALGADMPLHPLPICSRSTRAMTVDRDGCAHLQLFDRGSVVAAWPVRPAGSDGRYWTRFHDVLRRGCSARRSGAIAQAEGSGKASEVVLRLKRGPVRRVWRRGRR